MDGPVVDDLGDGPAGGEWKVLSAPLGGSDCYVLTRGGGRTFVVVDEGASTDEVREIMSEVRQMAGLPAVLMTLAHEAGVCGCQSSAG